MKNHTSPRRSTRTIFALTTLVFSPALTAVEALPGSGSEQAVTIAFTETITAPSLKPRDEAGKILTGELVGENAWSAATYNANNKPLVVTGNYEYGTKQVIFKISNKELLQKLIDEGDIPGPITGWALKFVNQGETPQSAAGRFYAVKAGLAPVELSGIVEIGGDGGAATVAVKSSLKTTHQYAPEGTELDGSPTETETVSYTANFLFNAWIEIAFSDRSLRLNGILSEAWSLKSFGTGAGKYWQFVPGAAKLDSGSGTMHFAGDEPGDSSSVMKGTISLAAGKTFPDIQAVYPDYEFEP